MRRRASFFVLFLFSACSGGQISENFAISFPDTVVCESTTQLIQFTNDTGGEMVIEGAAVSAGTDPYGNFSLEGLIVGSTEISSVGGALAEATVPAGEKYLFKVAYTPKTGDTAHEAVVDIAYRRPMGVYQLHLSGTSEGGTGEGCASFSEGTAVDYDGPSTLTVSKLVAATSKLSAALSSDDGVRPFTPVPLSLTLSRSQGTALLDPITSGFVLPRPNEDVPTLGRAMTQDTVITISEVASGNYDPSVGSLTIEGLMVTLDTDFNTTITVTLTTGEVSLDDLAAPLNSQAIQAFGTEHFDVVGGTIFGTPIDPETGLLALVGTTMIEFSTLDPGSNNLLGPGNLQGATMAILIEGQVSAVP